MSVIGVQGLNVREGAHARVLGGRFSPTCFELYMHAPAGTDLLCFKACIAARDEISQCNVHMAVDVFPPAAGFSMNQ